MVIIYFEVPESDVSGAIRSNLTHAIITGEGCSQDCKERAGEICLMLDDLSHKHCDGTITVETFSNNKRSAAVTRRNLEDALSPSAGFVIIYPTDEAMNR